ncbi:MAG: FliO/MopB family protein [Desulfosporosinus sp.]|jgi:flagellar protein FliO/FliZ
MSNIEDQPFPAAGTASVVTDNMFNWWGLMGTLLIFFLILIVSLWVIRRLYQANNRKMSVPWARVLDRQMLGGHHYLYLVEIAGQLQVLGGSDHHLLRISEINDPIVAAEILEEIANRPIEKVNWWTNTLQRLLSGRARKKNTFAAELQRMLDEVRK